MLSQRQLQQLCEVCAKLNFNKIVEVGELSNAPVYQFTFSNFPKGTKLGYPVLYSFVNEELVELNLDQIRQVIQQDLFRSGGKVIKQIGVN